MNTLKVLLATLAIIGGTLAKLRVAVVNFESIDASKYPELVSDLKKESVDVVTLFPNGPKSSPGLVDELKKNYYVNSHGGTILASTMKSTDEIMDLAAVYVLETNDGHMIAAATLEFPGADVEAMKSFIPEADKMLPESEHCIWMVNDMKKLHIVYTGGLKKRLQREQSITVAGSTVQVVEFDIHNSGFLSSKMIIGAVVVAAVIIAVVVGFFMMKKSSDSQQSAV